MVFERLNGPKFNSTKKKRGNWYWCVSKHGCGKQALRIEHNYHKYLMPPKYRFRCTVCKNKFTLEQMKQLNNVYDRSKNKR